MDIFYKPKMIRIKEAVTDGQRMILTLLEYSRSEASVPVRYIERQVVDPKDYKIKTLQKMVYAGFLRDAGYAPDLLTRQYEII